MDTYTLQPPGLTKAQHRRAEAEGWSVFQAFGSSFLLEGELIVQAIDDLGLLDDDEAVVKAREMGLPIDEDGRFTAPIHKAHWLRTITVEGSDGLPVEMELYSRTEGVCDLFAIDASFLDQVREIVPDPFNDNKYLNLGYD